MADQVVLMREGRIEQNGSPDELYENPATTFVARFVGTPPMNVLPLGALGGAFAPPGREADRLSIGIRPEAIGIGETGVGARVLAAEFLGADTLIEVEIAGETLIVRRPGKVRARSGEIIHLAWKAEDAFWFDRASEARIRL